MEKANPNFKTKLIYGLVVIVPIAIIVVVLAKLIEMLDLVAKTIGLKSTSGAGITVILALIFLLAVCYGVGALIHTKIGAWSFDKFEKTLLLQIPGYRIISNIIKGFAEDKVESYRPAMIQLGPPGTAVMGFVMEENDNQTLTVFVPSVPAVTVGGLHIVERSRVTLLEGRHLDIVTCITEWGTHSNKVIGNTPLPDNSRPEVKASNDNA